MSFFLDEDKKEIENTRLNSGFCIIVDIKDSTKRKINIPNWKIHTKTIYNAFLKLIDSITDYCNNCSNRCELSNKDMVKNLEKIMCKFTGDGGVAFLLTKNTNNNILSWCILNNIYQYINEIKDKELNELLDFLNIKFIITYLTEIYIYSNEENNFKDVMGRGMDFSFRIEKYSAPTHITINKLFFNNIKEFLKNKNINKNNFSYIQCRKNIKGWNNPQIFYLITNEELFSDTIETIIPSEDGDVNIELLKKFVKINGQEIIDENLNKKGINNE